MVDEELYAGERACDRVLVIGLDGATWDVLTPLAEQGVLPNIAALMRRAALAELRSTLPYITPVAWSSFLTGCDPQVHGVWDYRFLDHQAGELRLNNSARLPRPTLLDAVANSGGDVVSLNLPMTWPPREPVPGDIIVGGIEAPSIEAALAPFPKFAARLRAAGAALDLKTIWKSRPQSLAELQAGVAATTSDFHNRATAAEIADGMTDWRLMIVQYQTLDSLQHRCWNFLGGGILSNLDPQHATPTKSGELGCNQDAHRQTRRAFSALDDSVGRLLELAARRGAAVVALSDHGFGPLREKISVPILLEQSGFLRRAGWTTRLGYRATRSLWKVNRWRARRAAQSTAGVKRPLSGLAPIDWRRSRAFAVHGELGALVYLNTRERTANGPIRSESQRESAEDELLDLFHHARHPQSGEPLFELAFSTRRRFDCDPVERQWPDVIAIPSAGFQTRTKFDARGDLLRSDWNLPATHRREGVLLVDAPSVVTAQRHSADLRDVAPTILHMLGLAVPPQMRGRVQNQLFGSSAGVKHSALETCGVGHIPPPAMPELTHAQQQIVEQRLRDLGYLE